MRFLTLLACFIYTGVAIGFSVAEWQYGVGYYKWIALVFVVMAAVSAWLWDQFENWPNDNDR